MANKRTHLVLPDLADLHVDLGPQRLAAARSSGISGDLSNVVDEFPSLSRGKKERSVTFTLRLPVSQAEALEDLKQRLGVVPSELVRDFIAQGLKRVAGSGSVAE